MAQRARCRRGLGSMLDQQAGHRQQAMRDAATEARAPRKAGIHVQRAMVVRQRRKGGQHGLGEGQAVAHALTAPPPG
jgi:hypothetical protein